MIKLKRRNTIRIVDDHQAAELIAEGFRVIGRKQTKAAEAPAPAAPAAEASPESDRPLEDLTVGELRSMASARGIRGTGCLRKADLIEILREVL